MPLVYAPATYAGALGELGGCWWVLHSHRLESRPVNTVRPPIPFIHQVIAPITNVEMVRVDAAAVMTAMADHLMAVGG